MAEFRESHHIFKGHFHMTRFFALKWSLDLIFQAIPHRKLLAICFVYGNSSY